MNPSDITQFHVFGNWRLVTMPTQAIVVTELTMGVATVVTLVSTVTIFETFVNVSIVTIAPYT